MASYISVKELRKRRDSHAEIKSTCDNISQLKLGSCWVIIGYSRNTEFDSLTIIKEGLQWNTLLQLLPSNEVCYVYVRVEFGKMPGACFLIIWTGEEVSEGRMVSAKENENEIIALLPNNEGVIYARSHGNLNKQITERFKVNRTRHGSLRSGTLKKIQRPSKKSGLERVSISSSKAKNNRYSNFFLNDAEEKSAEQEKKVTGQEVQEKLKSDTTAQILHAKVIIIGDIAVGKSSLIRSYISGTEQTTTTSTIPVDYFSKTIKTQDKINLNLEIWDTMGEEKYTSLAPIWYRYAAAAILVYDKTDKESFHHIGDWLERVKTYTEPYITILVGHKSDLLGEEVVKKTEGFNYAYEKGMMFTETSIKDVKSIEQTFYLLSKRLIPKLLELDEGSQCYKRCRGKTILDMEAGRKDTVDMMSSFKLRKHSEVKADNNTSKCC